MSELSLPTAHDGRTRAVARRTLGAHVRRRTFSCARRGLGTARARGPPIRAQLLEDFGSDLRRLTISRLVTVRRRAKELVSLPSSPPSCNCSPSTARSASPRHCEKARWYDQKTYQEKRTTLPLQRSVGVFLVGEASFEGDLSAIRACAQAR